MAENQTDGYNATWIPGYTKPVDLDPYTYPAAHEKKFDTRKEWATSPQMYHNEIMNNYVTNVSKNLSEIPYVGNVLAAGAELGAPVASGILSLPYELKQSFDDFEKKLAANPEQYNSLGSTASGILQAIDDQNPLSTVYHRTKGALRPLGRRLENTWDALRNEFSGDVEAAEQVESYGPQRFETNSQMPIIDPNLNRLREEYEKKNPGIWEAIKNEFSGSAQADEIPINNITSSRILPKEKPLDTSRFQNMYWGPGQLEEAEDVGIQTLAPRKNFLRRIFDNSLMGRIFQGGGLSPAQQGHINRYSRNPITGRMTSGPFRGQNLFGTSMFGSKTAKEQALKNLNKWGKTAPDSRVKQWENVVRGDRAAGTGTTVTGHGKSGMGRDPRDRMEYGGLATMFERRR